MKKVMYRSSRKHGMKYKLSNDCKDLKFGAFKLFYIFKGDPALPREWQGYPFTPKPPLSQCDATLFERSMARMCFRLLDSGELLFEKYEYLYSDRNIPSWINERLEGDFWLELKVSSLSKPELRSLLSLLVPFKDGRIVRNQRNWLYRQNHKGKLSPFQVDLDISPLTTNGKKTEQANLPVVK